jgi:hypothetical protein
VVEFPTPLSHRYPVDSQFGNTTGIEHFLISGNGPASRQSLVNFLFRPCYNLDFNTMCILCPLVCFLLHVTPFPYLPVVLVFFGRPRLPSQWNFFVSTSGPSFLDSSSSACLQIRLPPRCTSVH